MDIKIHKAVCDFAYANQVPPLHLIKELLCDICDVSLEKFDSKTRKREVVQARQVAMAYLYSNRFKNPQLATYESIGQKIGGKDHATVMHACRTVKDQLSINDHTFGYIVGQFKMRLSQIDKNYSTNIL